MKTKLTNENNAFFHSFKNICICTDVAVFTYQLIHYIEKLIMLIIIRCREVNISILSKVKMGGITMTTLISSTTSVLHVLTMS